MRLGLRARRRDCWVDAGENAPGRKPLFGVSIAKLSLSGSRSRVIVWAGGLGEGRREKKKDRAQDTWRKLLFFFVFFFNKKILFSLYLVFFFLFYFPPPSLRCLWAKRWSVRSTYVQVPQRPQCYVVEFAGRGRVPAPVSCSELLCFCASAPLCLCASVPLCLLTPMPQCVSLGRVFPSCGRCTRRSLLSVHRLRQPERQGATAAPRRHRPARLLLQMAIFAFPPALLWSSCHMEFSNENDGRAWPAQ